MSKDGNAQPKILEKRLKKVEVAALIGYSRNSIPRLLETGELGGTDWQSVLEFVRKDERKKAYDEMLTALQERVDRRSTRRETIVD